MKRISDQLPRTISAMHKKRTSAQLPSLSTRQKDETEKFLQCFHSIEKVYSFFCPGRWDYAIEHTTECLTYPCITLNQVDGLYNAPGAATNIIKGHIIGVFGHSTAREQINAQAADLAASMFVAKYGGYCTLYDTMLYFSNYLLEFKQSFAAFDIQDILQQFSKKYSPWKRARLQTNSDTQETPGCGGLEEAMVRWMLQGTTDADIRAGGLYAMGRVTDKMIEDARAEYRKRIEGEVF